MEGFCLDRAKHHPDVTEHILITISFVFIYNKLYLFNNCFEPFEVVAHKNTQVMVRRIETLKEYK